jgi:hypothetical protein
MPNVHRTNIQKTKNATKSLRAFRPTEPDPDCAFPGVSGIVTGEEGNKGIEFEVPVTPTFGDPEICFPTLMV